MVGAYYPWLENKFGYVVGVPIKNPLISDIFSQIFIWKKFIADSFMRLELSLWNPYSYSGQPLLANFQSGALNPFNLLMGILGSVNGWTWLVISQTLGSIVTMFIFLKAIKREAISALIGATVYAFGGFAIIWSQFVNAGFTMIWIPLVFYVIEKSIGKNNKRYLLWLSPLFFLMVTAGHLQALIYMAILTVCYFVYRVGLKNKDFYVFFVISLFLSMCFGAIQLLPSVELMKHSIRLDDGAIKSVNFGLLPLGNLITIIAPDYFGNPSTGNFWGYFNYHGTVTYAGVIGVIGLVFGLVFFKKLKLGKFFLGAAVLALLFQFDTPLGMAVYKFKIPLLSTSDAARIDLVFLLSISVVVAEMIDILQTLKWREKVRLFIPPTLTVIFALAFSYISLRSFSQSDVVGLLLPSIKNLNVGIRNLAMPLLFTGALFGVFILSGKIKIWKWLVLLIVVGDLFRFGWKYIPFVPRQYIFPDMEVLSYIKKDPGLFRVDREKAELLPPNTWMAYGLMSPSGYDPMAITEYVKAYSRDLNKEINPGITRYSELMYYDAEALGKYNVKYLLAIKRDKLAIVPGDNINYKINEKEWKRVFQTPAVAVLLNTKYKERARVIKSDGTDAEGSALISSYENNKVVVSFTNVDGDRLLLADTYYPGWVATIDGNLTKIGDEVKPFRTVDIRGMKNGEIVFEYKPESFTYGLIISGVSLALWLLLMIIKPKK